MTGIANLWALGFRGFLHALTACTARFATQNAHRAETAYSPAFGRASSRYLIVNKRRIAPTLRRVAKHTFRPVRLAFSPVYDRPSGCRKRSLLHIQLAPRKPRLHHMLVRRPRKLLGIFVYIFYNYRCSAQMCTN
jgi:hypothetical protein